MGKKNHGKSAGKVGVIQSKTNSQTGHKVLSKQKRNDLNQLVDRLLKVSSSVQQTPNAAKDWENHLEIEKLLDKINVIESELKSTVSERSILLEQFTQWMKDNGANIDGVKITKFAEYGYGLQAERNFNEGDIILKVPRKLIMTLENASRAELGEILMKDMLLQHMPNIALALFLLVEKTKPDSFWKDYISTLPETYTTVLYFRTEDFLELKGSPTLEPALKQCQNIARQYAYLNKLFQMSTDPASELLRDVFTYNLYRWAVSTVMTRQNYVPSSTPGSDVPVNALIPMWDMCNHSNGKLSTEYSCESSGIECRSYRSFDAGEQLFIFYGARPNSDMFLHNGFVYAANEHDTTKVRLGVSRSDPLQALRSRLLEELQLPSNGDFPLGQTTSADGTVDLIDGSLLAFLRIFNMGQEHLEHWLSNKRSCDLQYKDCALDTVVECKTWNFLEARIKLLLSAYPTSADDDEKLLADPNSKLSPCRRLTVEMRLSEKKVLNRSLKYAQDCILYCGAVHKELRPK